MKTKEQIEQMAAVYLDTKSIRKTGAILGIPVQTVLNDLKPLGIVPDWKIPESEEELP